MLMTYPKGDPRHPIKGRGLYYKHIKKILLASLLSAIVFSFIIALYWEYKVTNIDFSGVKNTRIVKQSDGPYVITYLTSGPVFSSFHMSCTPGWPPDFGPYYNCVKLNYDGKPGIVELSIPLGLLSELDWIDRVNVFPFIDTSFQLISQDDIHRVYRIDIPSGYQAISLVGGTKTTFPFSFLLALGMFGVVLFLLSWFIFWLIMVQLPRRLDTLFK